MTDYVAGTMINQTTLFTSSSLYSGNINAGNIAAGNVSVTGTLPPPVGIYANAANSLALTTASAARLIIDPNGNVGIATGTALLARFTVSSASVSSFASTAGGALALSDPNTALGSYTALDFTTAAQGYAIARIASQYGSSGTSLTLGTSNNYATGITNAALTISPSGNVGIANTAPAFNLVINNAANGTMAQFGNGAYIGAYLSSAYLASSYFNSNGNWTAPANGASIIGVGGGTNPQIIFYIDNALTTGSTYGPSARMAIDQNGNVRVTNVTAFTNNTGFSFNGSINRTQISAFGFTFNQDGDVLTPTNKTRYAFSYTGADQTFTVPAGVYWIYVKLWGAGGGAGRAGGWTYGADAGGGGHTRALVPVTPGTTIYVKVGSGGTITNGTTAQYGGGGAATTAASTSYAGQGGGFCGIFASSITQGTALAIAGGGGGGGSSRAWTGNMGGAGGGVAGQRGASPYDGKYLGGGGGGTQSAGGAAGTAVAQGGTNNVGYVGSALQGGAQAINDYGGGGGGGYWGGGGGAYSESNTMGGGGGGSGYFISTAVYAQTYTGAYRTPAMFWDTDLVQGNNATLIEMLAYGGQNTMNNQAAGSPSGGNAYAVIYY